MTTLCNCQARRLCGGKWRKMPNSPFYRSSTQPLIYQSLLDLAERELLWWLLEVVTARALWLTSLIVQWCFGWSIVLGCLSWTLSTIRALWWTSISCTSSLVIDPFWIFSRRPCGLLFDWPRWLLSGVFWWSIVFGRLPWTSSTVRTLWSHGSLGCALCWSIIFGRPRDGPRRLLELFDLMVLGCALCWSIPFGRVSWTSSTVLRLTSFECSGCCLVIGPFRTSFLDLVSC